MEQETQSIESVMKQLGGVLAGGMESKLKDLEEKTEQRLKELEALATKTRPVLSVSINDAQERQLKTKAVPYLKRLITYSKLGENTLLIGPAGCGKTTGAEQLADALGLTFGTVCFTAGASETWLFGRPSPQGHVTAAFAELYEHGGVFLGDELDAADPNLLMAINTALANGKMNNPMTGKTVKRHKDFVFVGGANTVGKGADFVYTGRNRLDGASLDRFVSIAVDYDSDYEQSICPDPVLYEALTETRKRLREDSLEEILSTRTFDRCQKLQDAKVPMTQIIEAIALSWTDEAKGILKQELKKAKQSAKKGEDNEIPF